MTLFTCSAVRRRLAAFHDRELPVGEMIAIESHIQGCPPCARELRGLQSVGNALRRAAAPAPADDWTGLQSAVIGRMRVEAEESWPARAGRLFEDMHLVWIALASTAATFVCGATVLSLLHFASPERHDSLAGVIAVMAAPLGSNLNPARLDPLIQVPRVTLGDQLVGDMLSQTLSRDEVVVPLALTVTREGRVLGPSVIGNSHGDHDLTNILDGISRARLHPAESRFGGSPVAVNLVWLLAHTTVKGKIIS